MCYIIYIIGNLPKSYLDEVNFNIDESFENVVGEKNNVNNLHTKFSENFNRGNFLIIK